MYPGHHDHIEFLSLLIGCHKSKNLVHGAPPLLERG
jgi:hypothetical protein